MDVGLNRSVDHAGTAFGGISSPASFVRRTVTPSCASMPSLSCNPSDTAALVLELRNSARRLKCSHGGNHTRGRQSRDHLSKAELDRELNDALKGTFPASDPVSIGDAMSTEPDRPIGPKPALLDKELVHELAGAPEAKRAVTACPAVPRKQLNCF
jgi:hypothetical protein